MDIQNKKILITGASRGIGWSLAKSFAQYSTDLILIERKRDEAKTAELLKLGARSVKIIEADFSSQQGVQNLCDQVERENIHVDVLINNAGLLTGGLLEEQRLSDIYSMIQVNLLAVIQLCHFFVPRMLKQGGGKIVNNSSVSGKMFIPCANTYAASKAGVVALTESLQAELAGTGVSTLLLITPGVQTDMYNKIPDQYGKNLDLSFLSSISSDDWAKQVVAAVQSGQSHLNPSGATGLTVSLAQHFPALFRKLISTKFKRS